MCAYPPHPPPVSDLETELQRQRLYIHPPRDSKQKKKTSISDSCRNYGFTFMFILQQPCLSESTDDDIYIICTPVHDLQMQKV